MKILCGFLIYFFLGQFNLSYAAVGVEQINGNSQLYTWIANKHVMSPSSLANTNLASVNSAYINIDRIANATPLIKFYADRLIEERVPVDFAILPLIESGNNPQARSPMNALGLWQFIPSTGVEWGLARNQLHDERTDVNKSTIAAARYLRSLYNRYHDWNLVLASYNWGAGSVDRALKKGLKQVNGQINLQFLPQETRNYIVYFYLFNRQIELNHQHRGLSKYPNSPYLMEINSRDFNQHLSTTKSLQGMSRSVFSQANGFSPELMGSMKGTVLVPTALFSNYFSVEKVSFFNKKNYHHQASVSGCNKYVEAKYGDTIESIAAKHHLKVDVLIDLNPSVRFVRPGMIINLCESK